MLYLEDKAKDVVILYAGEADNRVIDYITYCKPVIDKQHEVVFYLGSLLEDTKANYVLVPTINTAVKNKAKALITDELKEYYFEWLARQKVLSIL